MNARDRLRASAEGHITRSIGADAPAPPAAAPAPAEANRYVGLGRVPAFAIPLDRIAVDPGQPRKEFDPGSLDRLARSLAERGQLQPCRVRWDEAAGGWVLVAGERRLRAARLAGLATLQCVDAARDLSPEDRLADQLVENCLREDLTPIEQAHAYRALMGQGGLSQHQLAEALRVSQTAVARALALLELPEAIRADVDAGAIAPATAYELTRVADPAEQADLAALAKAGRVKRDDVRRRAAKPRPAVETFRVSGGRVDVALDAGRAGPDAVAAALREALAAAEAACRAEVRDADRAA